MRRWVWLCGAIGCGPAVDAPASTDAGTGDDGRTGPMSDPITSASATVADESGPSDTTTGPILDVNAGTGTQCETASRVVGPLRSSWVILVDQSQTMVTETLDHDGDARTSEITRWSVLIDGLQAHLPALVDAADIGLQPFPSTDAPAPPDAAACSLVEDGWPPPTSADAILDSLPAADADALAGATPTLDGLARAYPLLAADPSVDRRLALFTDGAPNCSPDAQTPEQAFDLADPHAAMFVAAMADEGIVTHAIAIDVPTGTIGGGPEGDAITDHRARLQELASAGGTELALVDDAASLQAVLADLTDAARSCRLRIPPDLLAYPLVEVVLDPSEYLPVVDAATCLAGERGYRYLDLPGFDTIEFCGSACAAFKALPAAFVTGFCFAGPE